MQPRILITHDSRYPVANALALKERLEEIGIRVAVLHQKDACELEFIGFLFDQLHALSPP